LARRTSLGSGVPLVGPQEELRGPSGYIPRGFFEPRAGGEVRIFGVYNKKQKNEKNWASTRTRAAKMIGRHAASAPITAETHSGGVQ